MARLSDREFTASVSGGGPRPVFADLFTEDTILIRLTELRAVYPVVTLLWRYGPSDSWKRVNNE